MQRNIYDASGNLLLQTDPGQGASLFLGDTVLHQAGTDPVSAVRTYTAAGTSVAERTGTTGSSTVPLTWLFTDVDGNVDVQTDSTSGATTDSFRDPFGNPTSTGTGIWADGNGFLNDPATSSSGLVSLGARFYNPAIGRFVSADSVLEAGDPQQVNGYGYAANNPITNTDPSGLCANYATGILTMNVNCAGGHGSNKADAVTMNAKRSGSAGKLNSTPGWSSSYSAGESLLAKAQKQTDAIPVRNPWTVTPDQVRADLYAAGQAYASRDMGLILTSPQGALAFGWLEGALPRNLAYGPDSAITAGLRDRAPAEAYREQVKRALAAGGELPGGGYDAGTAKASNPNFVRDVATITDWADATNSDRSLAVIGSFGLNATVSSKSGRSAQVQFVASNTTSLGSGLGVTPGLRSALNAAVGATGPNSPVSETFSWTETVTW